jgi:hypothetical protein
MSIEPGCSSPSHTLYQPQSYKRISLEQIPIRLTTYSNRHCELATGRTADPPLMKPPPDRFPGESRDPFIRLLSA